MGAVHCCSSQGTHSVKLVEHSLGVLRGFSRGKEGAVVGEGLPRCCRVEYGGAVDSSKHRSA